MEFIEIVKMTLNGGAIVAVIYLAGQVKGLKSTLDKLEPLLENKADKSMVESLERTVNELSKELYKLLGSVGKGGL